MPRTGVFGMIMHDYVWSCQDSLTGMGGNQLILCAMYGSKQSVDPHGRSAAINGFPIKYMDCLSSL